MIDLDALVKVGWTGLIAWNLRETVSNGKELVRLKTLMENGLSATVDELKTSIETHIAGEERRILDALKRDPDRRTRKTDRRSLGRGEVDDA